MLILIGSIIVALGPFLMGLQALFVGDGPLSGRIVSALVLFFLAAFMVAWGWAWMSIFHPSS